MAQIASEAGEMTTGEGAEPHGIVFIGKIIDPAVVHCEYPAVFLRHWCNTHSETIRIDTRQILPAVQVRSPHYSGKRQLSARVTDRRGAHLPETALLLTGTGAIPHQCLDPVPAVTQHKVKGQQNRAFPGLIVPDQNVTVMSEAQVQFRKLLKFCSISRVIRGIFYSFIYR